MKITVINGTPQKGVTCKMKERFLDSFRKDSEITEFYPDAFPEFCTGCKNCFLQGEEKCPHFSKTAIVWESMMRSDIIVFAYPVYALRAPAGIKSLLDHLCVHWMTHRPEPAFFKKKAVIITNSIGAPNRAAQKDVATSLNWLGISFVSICGIPLMGDIFVDSMSEKHRRMIDEKMEKLADSVKSRNGGTHMSVKVWMFFQMAKLQHKMVLNSEEVPGLDSAHYLKHGWIRRF